MGRVVCDVIVIRDRDVKFLNPLIYFFTKLLYYILPHPGLDRCQDLN